MTGEPDYRWHLRKVMAGRGIFATTDPSPGIRAARRPVRCTESAPGHGRRAMNLRQASFQSLSQPGLTMRYS